MTKCTVSLQAGKQLVQDDHYAADSIQDKMSELKKKWEKLYSKMIERGDKLRQAGQQEQLMELLEVRGKCLSARKATAELSAIATVHKF